LRRVEGRQAEERSVMQRHLLASTSDGNDYVHCAINKPGDPSA
jgi:hypothetical protein